MNRPIVLFAAALLAAAPERYALAFHSTKASVRHHRATVLLAHGDESPTTSRAAFLSTAWSSSMSVAAVVAAPPASLADVEPQADVSAEAPASKPAARTIVGCPKPTSGKPNNCVSTSNVKQIDTYMPPWTYEVSADEAFARLKGAIVSDPSFSVTETDDSGRYIRADVKRTFEGQDEVEFLVRADDGVVTFKSTEKAEEKSISDFGANRNRVETIRKKAGVFDLMGGGMTADSYGGVPGGGGGGPLGQLKAFYGLQSGKGFQDVLSE